METVLELELTREGSCAATARRALEERLGGQLTPGFLADLKLVVTELAENAYVHGEGRIWLKLWGSDSRLRVEVIDEGGGADVKLKPVPSPEGGYGLRIVDKLAVAWGAYEGTTHVWAELALPHH